MNRHDKEALEFDVTHCRFGSFFWALGEPEPARCDPERPMSIHRCGGRQRVSLTRTRP